MNISVVKFIQNPPPKKLKFVLFTCGWVIFFDLLGYTEKVSPDVRLWQKGRTPTETKIDCYFCVCAWFKRNKKQHVKQTPSSKGWLDTTRLTFLHLQNCTRFNFQNLNLFVTDSKVLVKKKREREFKAPFKLLSINLTPSECVSLMSEWEPCGGFGLTCRDCNKR